MSYNKLGDASVQAGKLTDAVAYYTQALETRKKLAKDNPTSAEAARDLAASYYKLALVTDSKEDLENAFRILTNLKAKGRLFATDHPWLDAVAAQLEQLQ